MMTTQQGLQTTTLDRVPAELVDWLWKDRVPRGEITNVTGDPGVGKGWFTLNMIAKLTSGGLLPGMSEPLPEPINALLLSKEDDPAKVVRPRLEAMGAVLARVHFSTGLIVGKKGTKTQFNIAKADEIEEMVRQNNINLLVIDPIVDHLGGTEAHKGEEVARAMDHLHGLARRLNISIICVIHCNKGDVKALYKGSGSIQFAGKARSVFFIERSPESDKEKVVAHVKSNLGPLVASQCFTVEPLPGSGVPVLVWQPDKEGRWTAEDLLEGSSKGKGKGSSKLEVAKALIKGRLSAWKAEATELENLADDFKIRQSTLKKAKYELGVDSVKIGSQWFWYLPELGLDVGDAEKAPIEISTDSNELRSPLAELFRVFEAKLLERLGKGNYPPNSGQKLVTPSFFQGSGCSVGSEDTQGLWPTVLRGEMEAMVGYLSSQPSLSAILDAPEGTYSQEPDGDSWLAMLGLPWMRTKGARQATEGLAVPAWLTGLSANEDQSNYLISIN
jgi:hypothetical protein